MLLARGTRQIVKNTEFALLSSLMFGIDSFGFISLLIDVWHRIGNVSQHSPKFFSNPLQQPFCQTFFTTKVFNCMVSKASA